MTEDYPIKVPRKLIEVGIPLDAINEAGAKEKAVRHGLPSSMHNWWARRPMSVARAILFAQLVNDPGFQHGEGFKFGKNRKEAEQERTRLFEIIERLVCKDASAAVFDEAKKEILRSWREVCELNANHPRAGELFNPDEVPDIHDPFTGGGTIPLEGQRLGLNAYASDLNPVPVLINKGMVEIPYLFTEIPSLPHSGKGGRLVEGRSKFRRIADDIRFYGDVLLEHARAKLNTLYPKVKITEQLAADRRDLQPYVGQEVKVIAWIWARTVRSSNPAFSDVHVPLVKSFSLTTKKGKKAWVEPVIGKSGYDFKIRLDGQPTLKGTVSRKGGVCVMSGSPINFKYIRSESKAGRVGQRLMAIVAQGKSERLFLPPIESHEEIANSVQAERFTELEITHWPGCTNVVVYGLDRFLDLYTNRQLLTLTTFSELVDEIRTRIARDLAVGEFGSDTRRLEQGGAGAVSYADAISTYIAMAISKTANRSCSVAPWMPSVECPGHLFSRHAIPMNWDFAESNVLNGPSGSFASMLENTAIAVEKCESYSDVSGKALQADAQRIDFQNRVVSTDPPYYDNIPYAELSDFFYVWLRHSLRPIHPSLFSTMGVPKADELVANVQRHGNKANAEEFFLQGMLKAMSQMASTSHPAFPVTIYYAFKQAETKSDGTTSTGWVAFLEAVLNSGFSIVGTWPVRTERAARTRSIDSNALASSVVLVCRKRKKTAATISRREFVRELNRVLPEALDEMTKGAGDEHSPVAPVDLSQAMIGPGMAVFSHYSAVLEADGSRMSLKTALQLINRFLAEDDFDSDTQFCLHWFEQHGWDHEAFGQADVLARAKATSVSGLADAGVIESGGGKVRLLKWTEYPSDWDPQSDFRTPVWEALHHLIRALKQGGESAAGKVLEGVASKAEASRQLAYRLYTLCERKGWSEDARAYNELITSWAGIESAAPKIEQRELF